ncbi:MAG TPA: flagellar hook-associated protein FlgK [Actinobacteria bacterium]|nr:flagellar hook-associated protein FlgK [Actinomycetota bacterium]
MSSAFFGLEIGMRALRAQQRALDVTAHNIANANTPGFTRQRAELTTTPPFPMPEYNRPLIAGQVGTGVTVESIQRARDAFLDVQIRRENLSLGEWKAVKETLGQIEVIFNEPSEAGLDKVFADFWNAWHELSKNPESLVARASLREQSVTLTNAVNHVYFQLDELRNNLDGNVEIQVDKVNTIARQIADLNKQIMKIEISGDNANDLRDKRDLLLDELSEIINFTATETDDGGMVIYIRGRPLLVNDKIVELTTQANPLNDGLLDVVWSDDLSLVQVEKGNLKGTLDARDNYIPYYMGELDVLAGTIITEVNAMHNVGFALDGVTTGLDFFTGIGAVDIAVNPIFSDLTLIAASQGGEAGDGLNALGIAQLKDALIMAGGTTTFGEYYESLVAILGVKSQEASRLVKNEELLVEQLTNRRESVSGVSLDEEVVNMLKYQRAYQAASRVITVMDEMLDRLINNTGLAGR